MLINSWTELETSLGAIARIKRFESQTTPEEQPGEDRISPEDWPQKGKIEIQAITARYKFVMSRISWVLLTESSSTSLAL
jgi:ATP-binding cassette subfamily C (CFTR/MRP) protein 1